MNRIILSFLVAAAAVAAAPASACNRATVFFSLGSAEVTVDGRAALEQLALALAWKGPDLHHILLTSQTDTAGSKAVNRALAMRRAEAVRQILLTNQVPDGLIRITALGEDGAASSIPQGVRDRSLRRVDLLMQLNAQAQASQLEEGQPIC